MAARSRAVAAPRAVAPPPAALRLNGSLDRVDPDGTLEGWCWSPDAPEEPRTLAVLIDGREVARLVADRERPDLAAAGLGNGRHAFRHRLEPSALVPGASVVVSLREVASGQRIGAPASVTWRVAMPAAPPEALPALQGHLDRVSRDGWVSGWCWYPERPDVHVELDVLVDDVRVGSVRAESYRPDLQQAGIGDGTHGFAYALPYSALADRGTLTVAVQERGSGRALSEPIVMRLGRMAAAEERIHALERTIRLLRGQIEELQRGDTRREEERAARALFATVAAFFQNLAEGRPAASMSGALDELAARLPPLALALPEAPRASFLLAAVADVDTVHRCLASLHEAALDAAAEVILVGDGRDPRVALLPAVVRNLRYVHATEAGLIGALSAAARDARGALLVFLVPEARPGARWLDEVAATFAAEPECAAAGGPLVRGDGLLQHAGLFASADGTLRDPGRLAPADAPEHGFLRRVDALGGYLFAVRREAFHTAGGFGGLYSRLGHAAADLCARLRAGGASVFHQPLATALWIEGGEASEAEPPDLALGDEETLRLRERLRHEGWPAPANAARFAGHALVIDDDLPHRARDAGSVIAFEQMQLLRRLNYRVTCAPVHAPTLGEAARDDLARHGIEVAAPPHWASVTEYLREAGEWLDLVLIHRYPNAAMFAERVRELAPRAKLVLAVEDLHFLREARRAALGGGTVPPAAREAELRAIRAADATIVRSDHEQDLLRGEVDPKRLTLLRWIAMPRPPRTGFAERRDICFVGNFRHPPNVDGVTWFVAEVLPLLRAELPELRLLLAGSDMPAAVRDLAGEGVDVLGWVEDLAALFGRMRLSVAPLRFGAGFKGKVAASLAHGLPVVGSAISLEGTGLSSGDGVAVADSPDEFARAILHLHEDEALWREQSARALERVGALYSPDAALQTFSTMLQRLGLPARA
jgi:glycosyltransferase involved in cell wall biosynthesis